MAKEIRRYELALDTTEEEAGTMKARMRVEEAQRIRRAQQENTARPQHAARQSPQAEAR